MCIVISVKNGNEMSNERDRYWINTYSRVMTRTAIRESI